MREPCADWGGDYGLGRWGQMTTAHIHLDIMRCSFCCAARLSIAAGGASSDQALKLGLASLQQGGQLVKPATRACHTRTWHEGTNHDMIQPIILPVAQKAAAHRPTNDLAKWPARQEVPPHNQRSAQEATS